MSVFSSPRRVLTFVGLVVAWCALWRDISVANVLSGLILSWAVLWAGFGNGAGGRVRLVPLAKLVALVARDLAASTVSVAREVLTPTDYTDEGIIACETPAGSTRHLLLLVVAITLTPGTAVVDADPDTGTLYLHLLHAERSADTIAHAQRLATLACLAFPPPRSTPTIKGAGA